jgi:hypothetical protein
VLADVFPEILPFEKMTGIICKFGFALKVGELFFICLSISQVTIFTGKIKRREISLAESCTTMNVAEWF